WAWQNTFPERKAERIEPLEQLSHYFLHTLYPTAAGFYTVDFNDSSLEADSTTTVLLLIACGLGTPEATRYLELTRSQTQETALSLLRQYPQPVPAADLPTSCVYPEMGWAMLRSSWEKDATLLAVKSGYTWNHAHADAGSFILFQQGQPLIIDSGHCAYYRSEYTSYYRQSRAHNVILFNGAGQPEKDLFLGCKFPGRLHSPIDGLGFKYICADATGPMARWFYRNYRHWLWSGEVILVIDDVRAFEPGQMDWLLHFKGRYAKQSGGGVNIQNGPAAAVVQMLYPEVALREETGLSTGSPDKKVPYLAFSPGAQSDSCRFITTICLNPGALPKFQVLQGQDYIGVQMTTAEAVEECYLNLAAINTPGTICTRIGDWTTDAYLLHLKRSPSKGGSVQRYFMGDGSYLRHQGRSVMESLAKATACWSPGESFEIFSGHAVDPIQFGAEQAPARVRWNGRPVESRYDEATGLFSIQGH
ncbi:MAG TPA: heparinase II/III family protein, partial [Verrucomicrobiae bacterium]|nr:heparinase II/III family protein [Verrucomicrobiae bacterium]